jgi:hydrogenase maturation protein HypF
MQSFHLHIKGIVQGVGFRPSIHKLAETMQIEGQVTNTTDGVHVWFTADKEIAHRFYHDIMLHHPPNAVITEHLFRDIPLQLFEGFSILPSSGANAPDLLLTPDKALCDSCRKEIHDKNNRRYGYAFTTCLNCGPRYSILKTLPYDREKTTMAELEMCEDCKAEFSDINDRRNYSQTNSCPECRIPMKLHGIDVEEDLILEKTAQLLNEGKILAVKGIGGYLLLCDATNETAIRTLRERKKRPSKPLAVLFPNIDAARNEVRIRPIEEKALLSKYAPIVLCTLNKTGSLENVSELLAPGLDRLGVMLPYTPLLDLLAGIVSKPLVATSGNCSGSPIIYKDNEAIELLGDIADHILSFERDIVTPQDDSVVQFNEKEQLIILRRSRGLAPNYVPGLFPEGGSYLAMGAELKSAFAIQQNKNLYVSQYLGNQESLESQQSYRETLEHVNAMLHIKPRAIIIDKHPHYHISEYGKQLHRISGAKLIEVQHHEAHFAAVLAEHKLLDTSEAVLGFVWDGTGYGNDGQIWGSESFIFSDGKMERAAHLRYFPQLLGDKMSREPRLSALSLLHNFHEYHNFVSRYFTANEWGLYQKLLAQDNKLSTCSMGRFLDAIACILGICTHNSYEGEGAMLLESLALSERHKTNYSYSLPLVSGQLDWEVFVEQLMYDMKLARSRGWIALKVFNALVDVISQISDHLNIRQLAFSGGVFQNAHLTSLIQQRLRGKKQLFFHRQLSPNDECIGVGQIALAHLEEKNFITSSNKKHVLSDPR